MKKELNQTDAPYSLRSQRTLLEEFAIEQDREKCDTRIRFLQRKIGELENDRERQFKASLKGDASGVYLGRTLAEVEEKTRELSEFQSRRAQFHSQIEELGKISPTQAGERKERQIYFAALAETRLEKDRTIGTALGEVRRLLQERAELTDSMRKTAVALEFIVDGIDGLDEQRFKTLLDSLPAEIVESSTRWLAWLFGEQEKTKPYVVRDESVVLPETLARHGFYRFGERIMLTDERARELLRENRPGRDNFKSRIYLPPSVMTVEAFEAATTAAEKEGCSVQDYLRRQWEMRREELRKGDFANLNVEHSSASLA